MFLCFSEKSAEWKEATGDPGRPHTSAPPVNTSPWIRAGRGTHGHQNRATATEQGWRHMLDAFLHNKILCTLNIHRKYIFVFLHHRKLLICKNIISFGLKLILWAQNYFINYTSGLLFTQFIPVSAFLSLPPFIYLFYNLSFCNSLQFPFLPFTVRNVQLLISHYFPIKNLNMNSRWGRRSKFLWRKSHKLRGKTCCNVKVRRRLGEG